MAVTKINFLRGNGFPSGYAFAANNGGTIVSAQPWVNKATKQLWVDNVCINPTLKSLSNYLTLSWTKEANNEISQNLNFDFDQLKSDLNIPTLPEYQLLTIVKGNNKIEYNTSTAKTLTIGDGLAFDGSTLSSTVTVDSFLNSVSIVNANGEGTPGTFMKFEFNTATNGAQTIYADVAAFYDNTDTKTKVKAGNIINIAANPTAFTEGSLNEFTVNHNSITTTPNNAGVTTPTDLTNGGNFTAVTGVTTDGYGHVTGYNLSKFNLPSVTIPDQVYEELSGNATIEKAIWSLDTEDTNYGKVSLQHVAQTSGIGSYVEFTKESISGEDALIMHITVIDGGEF